MVMALCFVNIVIYARQDLRAYAQEVKLLAEGNKV